MSTTTHPTYPRPKILDSLPPTGHQVIEASAGTGKTFTLEHLVVERVLSGTELTRILVVTFTDRAAAELRARIRKLLWSLLVRARGLSTTAVDGPAWTLDAIAEQRIAKALSRIDAAAISTIHAFCQSLLTENAFAHRRLFSQQLTDGKEIFSSVFREYLRTKLKSDPDFALLLRPHLASASYEEDGALSTLEESMYKVVRFHGKLEPLLDQAAIDAALRLLPTNLPTADQISTHYSGRLGREKIVQVLGPLLQALELARAQSGTRRLLLLGEAHAPGSGAQTPRAVDYALKVLATTALATAPALHDVLTVLANQLPRPDTLLFLLHREPLRERIREHKEARGLFDYDDMLEVVAASLEGEAAEAVKSSLRERYDFALIDEFQDTDPVQWKVFQTIFGDSGGKTWLSVIGDPKQAIYGFRAADVETYLGARESLLGETDAAILEDRIVRLKENFRSSERMIRAYNLVLKQGGPDSGALFQADSRITYGERAEVRCGDKLVRLVDGAGQEVTPIQILRADLTGIGKGKGVTVEPLARFIAAEVERLLGPNGPRLQDKHSPSGRPLRANDIYVLSRAKADAQAVAVQLGLRGLPFSFYKLDGLFETEEIGDLIDLLSAVIDPFDRSRRVRAWLTPFFGLSPAEAELALEAADDHPLVQRLRDWHAHAVNRDFSRLFSALIEESGLARRAAVLPSDERPLTNILRVLELLSAESRRRHATLSELVDLLRSWRAGRAKPIQQDADTQPLETDQPAVQLMTMHAAKGLEAAVVFLVGGAMAAHRDLLNVYHHDGERRAWMGKVPPALAESVDRESRGEDERLLYVALTRARVRMVLAQFIDTDKKSGEVGPAKLSGTYAPLNTRLWHLLQHAHDKTLFEVIPLELDSKGDSPDSTNTRAAALTAWRPSAPIAIEAALEAPRRRALALERKGALVTSYSQLSSSKKYVHAEVDKQEATGETNEADTRADELMTSNVVGNFLHESLEALDLARVRGFASAEMFAKEPRVRALVERLADSAGIAKAQRPHAYRMLYAALRNPISLGTAGTLPGIATLPKVQRELEFLFPIPERGHRLLGRSGDALEAPFAVRRGFVKGYIDVVFEHEGRVYFGDWKSSLLPDASPGALQRYIATHFHWQVVVYGIAVLRLLGIVDEASFEKRFGGFLYLFLRDMERTPPGHASQGIWFERPDWNTVKSWERELLDHNFGPNEGTP